MTDRWIHDAPSTHATRGARGGFTLIEILVVLFILGILAAIVVSIAGYVMNSASRHETAAIQKTLFEAVQAYRDANVPKGYPPDHYGSEPNASISGRVLVNYLTGQLDTNQDGTQDPSSVVQPATVEAATKALLTLPKEAWDGNWNSAVKDGWRVAMRYEAAGGLGGRPVIISAGPDGRFGKDDPGQDDDAKEEDNIRSDESQ